MGWYYAQDRSATNQRHVVLCIVLLLISAGLLGCEENLAPRDNSETPFSIWGVLSPDLEIQSIRVYPLEDFPTLGAPEPLDVDVFSTDLDTGERVTWSDTVLIDANGQHEYLYWARFQAEFGRRYRIDVVRRMDGARSFAEVRVPGPVTVGIVDDRNAAAVQVLIEGDSIRALKPEAVYNLRDPAPGCRVLRNRFSYEGREQRVENGWRVDINLVSDRNDLLWDCGGITKFPPPCPPAYTGLRSLNLHMIVGDVDWDPPDGRFDPNVLSQPGTLSNVENGFGFVGAGYHVVTAIFPSEEALEYACFVST